MPGGALSGVRVMDFTTGSFGYAGHLLAGLGAAVIKVEPPSGDPIRESGPFVADVAAPDRGGRHFHMNAGKQSVRIDLDTDDGCASARRLASRADVVLESFPPGYLAARGLAYDHLAADRAELVMASITHFGQDGPYAHAPGSEIVAAALSGYLSLSGDPDREPVKAYDNLAEQQASLHAAIGVLVAITRRDLTGLGDHLDVSVQEAALFLLGGQAQIYEGTGWLPTRSGTRLLFNDPELFYPSTIRPCKGGYVHAHSNNRHPDLLAVLIEDERLNDPRLANEPLGHADEIDELLDAWLAKHDKFEAVALAQELRLPFTEVLTPEEIVHDDHLAERAFFTEVDHPIVGHIRQPGTPAIFSETPWRTERAPLLGEHDRLVSELE